MLAKYFRYYIKIKCNVITRISKKENYKLQ